MAKKAATKKKAIDKDLATKILKTSFCREEAFYFFAGVGQFTGIIASSLADFGDKLKTINVESVNFHFSRQDFSKWIKETLGDVELANQINGIAGLKGEGLRQGILQKVRRRLVELNNATAALDKK